MKLGGNIRNHFDLFSKPNINMDVRSTAEGGGWSVESVWLFHKKEYVISCTVRSNLLTLEVEEQLTADRWKSQFEAKRK